MIGPVSNTGRAMMASLQQAMAKGMPPDQAVQYVKSMAMQGVAPLADLYSMMNQFQRLKQQQVQPPQTPPTIKDQLNMMDQMQQMQGGIAGMQAPPPAGQPMDRGLGAIDAGRMEYPQFAGGGMVALAGGGDIDDGTIRMANGTPRYIFNDELQAQIPSFMTGDMDIVSFVKAQMAGFDRLSPAEKQEVLRRFEPMYNQARAAKLQLEGRGVPAEAPPEAAPEAVINARNPFAEPELDIDAALAAEFSRLGTRVGGEEPAVATGPTVEKRRVEARPRAETKPEGDMFSPYELQAPDLAKIRAEREERQQRTKTGAYSQADADLAAYIREQKEQGGDEKQAYRNFWVMTGASLMANKSQYFLRALGESVQSNYGNLVKDLKSLKEDTKQLRLQEIQLQRAREQAVESGDQADQARFEALRDRAEARNFKILEARVNIEQKVLDRNHATALANLRAGGQYDMADMATKLWFAAEGETDPVKKKALLDQYQRTLGAATEITRATTAGGAGSASREEIAVANAVQKRKEQSDYKRNERVYYSDSATPEAKAAAKARMDEMERKAATDAASILGVPVSGSSGYVPSIDSGTGGGPYSTSGWDQ